jgi:hypothetical protein
MELTKMTAAKVSRLDQLTSVEFVSPCSLELEFSDKLFVMAVADLEIPDGLVVWDTVKVSEFGDKITVNGTNGKLVPIDAATLRYLVDPDYAEILDAQLAKLQFTDEELDRLCKDAKPSQEWFDELN